MAKHHGGPDHYHPGKLVANRDLALPARLDVARRGARVGTDTGDVHETLDAGRSAEAGHAPRPLDVYRLEGLLRVLDIEADRIYGSACASERRRD